MVPVIERQQVAPWGIKINNELLREHSYYVIENYLVLTTSTTEGPLLEGYQKRMKAHCEGVIQMKIILRDKSMVQISYFQYLGCDGRYEYDKDLINKMNKYVMSFINNEIKLDWRCKSTYTILWPCLYGSEILTSTKANQQRLWTLRMKFL